MIMIRGNSLSEVINNLDGEISDIAGTIETTIHELGDLLKCEDLDEIKDGIQNKMKELEELHNTI